MKPQKSWISAEELLASGVSLRIARPWEPVHDSACRRFLRGLIGLPGVSAVECQVAPAPVVTHLIRVRFTAARGVTWDHPSLEFAGMFFAVEDPESMPRQDGAVAWLIQWTAPNSRWKTDRAKHQAHMSTIQDWGERHVLGFGFQGLFVEVGVLIDVGGAVVLPTWPRFLTHKQTREALLSLKSMPGVDRCFIEVLRAVRYEDDRSWPNGGDLAIAGSVSEDDLIAAFEQLGLAGVSKRVASIEFVECVTSDGSGTERAPVNHAVWLADQLDPVWTRTPASVKKSMDPAKKWWPTPEEWE